MRLKLSISTCPNDTFMFYALLHSKVDTRGLEFDLHLADIEELNQDVANTDISKISYAVYPLIEDRFVILNSGSALGRGNGPLMVSRGKLASLEGVKVSLPGEHTTANLLTQKLFPEIGERRYCLFSDVASAVLSGEVDAGVLIHEGRFTYQEQGLELVADLGVEWERVSGLPLPLGAIVISRSVSMEVAKKFDNVLRESIEYSFEHPEESRGFVKKYARELSDDVISSHIELFVNQYSLALEDEGKRAVTSLLGSGSFL